jgi:hypothetical protein
MSLYLTIPLSQQCRSQCLAFHAGDGSFYWSRFQTDAPCTLVGDTREAGRGDPIIGEGTGEGVGCLPAFLVLGCMFLYLLINES